MVFKIRDKSLFWTKAGWKNNWWPKVLSIPKNTAKYQTAYITTRKDHHSFLRMVQSYRNYSRICKQYFYGDKNLENLLQMELRAAFRIPFDCSTPVHLIKGGCERRMADQLDRDYQLLTYNYHPFQLYVYKLQNNKIREQNQQAQRVEKGEVSSSQHIQQLFERELASQSARLPRGEKLSIEKLGQVYSRVVNATREASGEADLTRGPDGEYNDYLDKRRPFTEADNLRPSH